MSLNKWQFPVLHPKLIVVLDSGSGQRFWTAVPDSGGVGRLTLIDMDHVAESNINRQIHALSGTVGQAKVLAMRDRIAQINPFCRVDCVDDFVDADNWPGLLAGVAVDAVIDACDQVKAKTAMAAWALSGKHRLISVGAAGGKRLAHKVDIDDLAATTHDPLLAQLRYRLRKHHRAARDGKKMGVVCVFSREAVAVGTGFHAEGWAAFDGCVEVVARLMFHPQYLEAVGAVGVAFVLGELEAVPWAKAFGWLT
eukprot:gene41199-50997_t